MSQLSHVQKEPSAPTDDGRWNMLDLLTEAREALHLSVDDILVVRALLTFLPKGDFHSSSENKIVFPSNLTLAARCGGMEERTLRRHVARLEKLGYIKRKLSPSKKRFACRDHNGRIIAAYGMDLAPLISALPDIEHSVYTVREEAADAQFLQTRIRDCLYRLTIEVTDQPRLLSHEDERLLRNLLRRKPILSALRTALDHLEGLLDHIKIPEICAEPTHHLSDSDGQSVRHIQSSKKESEESEHNLPSSTTYPASAKKTNPSRRLPRAGSKDGADKNVCDESLTFRRCQDALREGLSFATFAIENWAGLVRLSNQLAPMMGIPRDVLDCAIRTMGTLKASLTILAIIEMRDRVKRPGAYLRALCDKAGRQEFSIGRMISAIESRMSTGMFPAGNAHVQLG
jgi:replication initiation protein RepC